MHLKTQYCKIHSSSICLPNSEFKNLWPGSSNQFLALLPPSGAAKVEGAGHSQLCSLLLQERPHWHMCARSRNVLCFPLSALTKEEVLEEMGDTVGLWPRQQSSGGGSTWRTETYLCSSNLLWILFGKQESQAVMMSGVKITLRKEHLWSVMLWSKIFPPKIHHQGLNRYESLKIIFSVLHYIKNRALNPIRQNY